VNDETLAMRLASALLGDDAGDAYATKKNNQSGPPRRTRVTNTERTAWCICTRTIAWVNTVRVAFLKILTHRLPIQD